MNNSTSPKSRTTRTGARGGSRTGHKSTSSSKSATTNGTKSSPKQASPKEQHDPSRPRFTRSNLLAGEHLLPQESMPDPYLLCNTSATSSYRFGKSIPIVLHSGHDKLLKVADNVRKLSLKTTTSRQVVSCEGGRAGYLSMPTYKDSQPRNSEQSSSGKRTNLDWTDSNSGLISDLCDIVRDGIMESGLNDTECLIKPALTPMMQTLIDRIIKESRIIPIPEWIADMRQCPGRSSIATSTESAASTTNSSNGGPSSSPSARSSLITNGKFGKNERDDELSDEDEDKLPKGPPDTDTLSNEAEMGLRLACPFQKHDPKKYNAPNYRSCASTGWDSISRVKEHLYRRHRMPIHCKRCHKQFSSVEELDHHTLVDKSKVCEVRIGETTEGITPDVEKLLKRRKRDPPNQTDEKYWKSIYRSLFPKDKAVPDPYVELSQCEPIMSNNHQDLAEFKKYSRLELPRLMRNQLETEFNLDEDFKSRLLSTLQHCHELLFSEYDAARRLSQTPSADSVAPSHYQAEKATADESQRSFSTGQAIDQLAPTSRLLPQRISEGSSMQGVSNVPTIVERNGAHVYTDSGYGEDISSYPPETQDMMGANNGFYDHPMLEAPDLYSGISRGAHLDMAGSEYGWNLTSEEFH